VSLDREGLSGLGRPLDPEWATNRVVLALVPVAGLVGVLWAWPGPGTGGVITTGLTAAGAAFGGWALGREVDPDRQGAAFAGMALAFLAGLVVPDGSLLLLFTALMLVRVVNRTTGMAATVLDDALVVGLVVWCVFSTSNALVALVAGVAFALDATLRSPEFEKGPPRHWAVAVIMLLVALWVGSAAPWAWPAATTVMAAGLVVAVFSAHAVSTREITSRCDRTETRLSLTRVRAGMMIALGIATSTIPFGDPGIRAGAPLWATLAGVAIWRGLHWRGRQPSP